MRATSISGHEKRFFDSGRDSHGKQFILKNRSIATGDTGIAMDYTSCIRENKDKSFYYEEAFDKVHIVIHFTAGFLKGDLATLTTPSNHVSVPFVIARNGTILNLWSSKYWSYHLGRGAVGGNTNMSQKTIGIELSNIGFLKNVGKNLATIYSDNDTYCSLEENGYYKLQKPMFRKEKYYATFTDKQYTSLVCAAQISN